MSVPAPTSANRLSGFARRLVLEGLISEDEITVAQETARKKKVSLGDYLVQQGRITSATLAHLASLEFGLALIDLAALDPESIPKGLVEEKVLRKHHVLPIFKRGNRLFVALSDPLNHSVLDEIKFITGLLTEPVLAEQDKLIKCIEGAVGAMDTSLTEVGDLEEDLDKLEINTEDETGPDIRESDVEDAPVVRFVNKVLLDAINKKASDIHFEPYEKNYRVRLRIDGVLREVANPPSVLAPKLAARLKVMSRLDISERRVPQDGRIKMQLSKNRAIDFRVSTCPTLFGEKVVMRILDPSSAKLGIDALGYEADQKRLYLETLAKPYGMILVTGPTGSGKTVSLYTGLNILNTPDRNISTAEDPVEINLPGTNQVNVNPKIGLTFASALRAFLRQDPDIIMVGEIRDLETAEIAIKAAQTGHLVLSTLHTNDAPQTLNRLSNMGVPTYNIASAVSLIIAQRLARRLCERCKTLHEVPKETLLKTGFAEDEIDKLRLYKAKGCADCTDGYKGRVGIYQVMAISEAMGHLIMAGGNALQLAAQARSEGIPNLYESGLKKVRNGVTSLEELNRVITV